MQHSSGLGTGDSNLQGVAATSAHNAWAVGSLGTGLAERSLILHWNGTRWQAQASPNAGTANNTLAAVTAVNAKQAWAVG